MTHGQHHDPVAHPRHYTFGPIQVIEAIEAWQLGFHLGNVLKYVVRAAHKGSYVEDLRKARWYLEREIERAEAAAMETVVTPGTPAPLSPIFREAGPCHRHVSPHESTTQLRT